jgi:hypothetical protein
MDQGLLITSQCFATTGPHNTQDKQISIETENKIRYFMAADIETSQTV